MILIKKYFPFALLLLVLFFVEWFIHPLGEFSLNDDWAYAKVVYHWNNTGEFSIGIWPAMSLWSHALLGLTFVKLFGFSLTVLRLANMALCLLTLFYIYKFFIKSNKPTISALVCAFIIFNPYYLNLFNSFMTDLSFFNFSFLAFYYLNEYIQNRKWYFMLLFFGLAILAMLTRQLGIILFLSFVLISILNYRKIGAAILIISLSSLFGALLILFLFEQKQFAQLKLGSAYQGLFFSHQKIKTGLHSFPLLIDKSFMIIKFSGSLLGLVILINGQKIWNRIKECNKLILALIGFVFAYYLFSMTTDKAVGNLFINLGLGVESTVDMLMVRGDDKHASNNFIYYSILFVFAIGYLLFSLFVGSIKWEKKMFQSLHPTKQFITLILVLYLMLIGIAESSFDRYCVYFMLFFVMYLMSTKLVISKSGRVVSLVFFIYLASFSIFSTHDYFTAAHLKREIRMNLVNIDKVPVNQINAGLEYQLWNGTEDEMDWINWDHYNDKKFIISRNAVSNFEIYKIYSYQRCMPLQMDTFFVLRNALIP